MDITRFAMKLFTYRLVLRWCRFPPWLSHRDQYFEWNTSSLRSYKFFWVTVKAFCRSMKGVQFFFPVKRLHFVKYTSLNIRVTLKRFVTCSVQGVIFWGGLPNCLLYIFTSKLLHLQFPSNSWAAFRRGMYARCSSGVHHTRQRLAWSWPRINQCPPGTHSVLL